MGPGPIGFLISGPSLGRAKKKATPKRGPSMKVVKTRLSWTLLRPVSQTNNLPDLPPLIAVLLRLDRTVVRFPEWMFGITDYLSDKIQRFCHSHVFLSSRGLQA